MDILANAQQQINDAAKQIDPNAAATPPAAPPPPPPTPPAPLLKEEGMLPPKPEPVAPPAPQPAAPVMEPKTTTFGAPAMPEEKPTPPPPPPKKGGVSKGVIIAGLFLLVATLPIAVYYVSQQQQQLTETRSRAAGESCSWCAGADQCPHAPVSAPNVCSNGWCCEGYVAGGGAPAPTGGGGGGTTKLPDNITSGCCSRDQQCIDWFGSVSRCSNPNGACQSGKQCKGSTCTPTHVCTNADCGQPNGCGQICNGGCGGGGGPTPSSTITGTQCIGNCCQANTTTAAGLYVQKCTCSGPLVNGRCLENCVNAGGYACIPDNFCGSMQLDIRSAAGEAAQGNTEIAKNGNGVCGPTPSGCKSDWCTSAADCTSKGGTIGTPQSFPSCSPGLVACCGVPSQPTPTPTQPPAGQCTRIKIYKGNVAVDPATLKVGDSVLLAVAGVNATKGRIRVNGAAFTETTTKNANGEYTVPFTVPDGVLSFTIEAEVFTNSQWK